MDLQPGEERLLSYAVVLGAEVKPEAPANGGRLTQVKVVQGVLYTTTKLRETKTYTVRDRNPQGRTVLIGHPVKDQFQLFPCRSPYKDHPRKGYLGLQDHGAPCWFKNIKIKPLK
jgi:hypothetical protein